MASGRPGIDATVLRTLTVALLMAIPARIASGNSMIETAFLSMPDGGEIRYAVMDAPPVPRGTVLLLEGKGEFLERYEELASEWHDLGFRVIVFDWRGQGLSTRFIPGEQRAHVPDFDLLAADLGHLLEQVVWTRHNGVAVVVAHSMGAAILLRHLARHGGRFDAAILSAPMLDIITDPYPRWVADLVSRLLTALGFGRAYAFGQSDWNPETDGRFEGNPFTADEVRFRWLTDRFATDPRYVVGGVTFGWLAAAFRLTALLAVPGATARVDIPILMLSPKTDRIVPSASHHRICTRLLNCRLVVLDRSGHEPWMETEDIRADIWMEQKAFLREALWLDLP